MSKLTDKIEALLHKGARKELYDAELRHNDNLRDILADVRELERERDYCAREMNELRSQLENGRRRHKEECDALTVQRESLVETRRQAKREAYDHALMLVNRIDAGTQSIGGVWMDLMREINAIENGGQNAIDALEGEDND